MTAEQLASIYRWSPAYVRKLASRNRWSKITIDGRARYYREHADATYWACRDAAEVKTA